MEEVEIEGLDNLTLKKLKERISYEIEDIDNKIIIDRDTRNLDGKCFEYELNIQKDTLNRVLVIIDEMVINKWITVNIFLLMY